MSSLTIYDPAMNWVQYEVEVVVDGTAPECPNGTATGEQFPVAVKSFGELPSGLPCVDLQSGIEQHSEAVGDLAGNEDTMPLHNKSDGSKAWTYTTVSGGEDGAMVWSSVGIDVATNTVYASTGNGVDEGHINVPSPLAPSFIALDKNTGDLVWESALPGRRPAGRKLFIHWRFMR